MPATSPLQSPAVRLLAEQALSRSAGAPLLGGNAVELLIDAEAHYAAWLAAIRGARRCVLLENYIIRDDEVGRAFRDALAERAHAGVFVAVVADWMGCLGQSGRAFWQPLRAAGGLNVFIQNTVYPDTPTTWSSWFLRQTPERRAKSKEAFLEGSFGHALWPGLEVTPDDIKVPKSRFGAFVPGASDLHAILQARGIDTLIITGTATNVCCESTARDAMMMNYKVAFIADGTATHSDVEHNATLGNLIANFADVMTTDEVIALLAKEARTHPVSGHFCPIFF